MIIEKEIGAGDDYVYVYYNSNDKKLAELEKRDRWECKIGFSSTDPIKRILSQKIQTSIAREPIIGLLIRTNNGYYTESWLHKELFRYKIQRESNVCGDEWFLTSPNEIENIFTNKASPTANSSINYCEYKISNNTLGEIANLHRKKINLTHKKLCQLTNLSRDTLSRFFNEDPNINLSNVVKILEALDLEITLKSRLPFDKIKKYESKRKAR